MLSPAILLSLFAMTPLQNGGAGGEVAKTTQGLKDGKAADSTAPKNAAKKAAQPAGAQAGLKIAVVDWEKILDGSRWIRALERNAQRELQPRTKKLDELRAERARLRTELALQTPPSIEYNEMVVELKVVEFTLQNTQQLMKGLWGRKLQEMTFHFNKTINQKIASYSRNHGIHLVLRKNSPSSLKNVPLGSKVQEQERNSVLYFHPSLDITKQIVELLDSGVPVEANAGKKPAAGKAAEKAKAGVTPGKNGNR